MGCAKGKKNTLGVVISSFQNIFFIYLVFSMFVFSFLTPVVFGGPHADYIKVTFTPSGDISLDVNQTGATFTVTAGTGGNSPTQGSSTSEWCLWNNGSVAAKVYIWQNGSTVGSEWACDSDGSPGIDYYSIRTINGSGGAQHYITSTNHSWINSLAGAGGTNTFGLRLSVGNCSDDAKLDAQVTRINITGIKA